MIALVLPVTSIVGRLSSGWLCDRFDNRRILGMGFSCIAEVRTIETINGEEAARSPYLDALRISFEVVVDYKKVSLFSSATGR